MAEKIFNRKRLIVPAVAVILVVSAAAAAIVLFSKRSEEVITTTVPQLKTEAQLIEELRESTSSLTPQLVTEKLTLDPAEGSITNIAGRKLTVKEGSKAWDFTALDDVTVTRTTFPATAEGGKVPTTENINFNELSVGLRVSALLERDSTGHVISRRINVLQSTR